MKLSLTEFQAKELIECWKADGLVGACAHFLPKNYLYPVTIRVRVYIPSLNHLANNMAWAGKFDKAVTCLMKYGLHSTEKGYLNEINASDLNKADGFKALDFKLKKSKVGSAE